ncbi:MAG: AAA family ATPase [Pseudomonadota bacterium]
MKDTPETLDHDQLRRQLTTMVEQTHGLSYNGASKRMQDVSRATLSQWLNGRYTGDSNRVASEVASFLENQDEAAGVKALVTAAPTFQRTQTAERIWTLLISAQFTPSIVVVAGAPGVGKTMTAAAYKAAQPNVWHATMDPTVVSPTQVLQEIALVIGERIGSPTTLRNRIGERMIDSGGLLIIDEAQHCSPKALDLLRALYDRYKVGIALIGNYGLFAATSAPNRTHSFAQFFRRVQRRAKFEEPSKADINMLLDELRVNDADDRAFLHTIGQKMWGLSGVVNTLNLATQIAYGSKSPMTLDHLRQAWASLNHFEG